MSGRNINFDDKKINKSNFYKNKKLLNIYDIDINKILISEKEPYGKKSSFKYFLGYNDDHDVIRPLCIKLSQMIVYVKCFDSNKTMSLKVNDNRLLKKYTKIWEKVSNLMDIEFDSEHVHGDNDKIHIWEKVSNLMDIEFDREPVHGDNDKIDKDKNKVILR